MNSKEALEFLTEGICNCPNCSKYVECMNLDESESVCENAKFIIKQDLIRLEQLEKENQELRKRETPIILDGVVEINPKVFYGICDKCGSPNRLAQHYDDKQKKWIKQGYCIHCGQKYDWSDNNE